jgi:hypothetical protein
MAKPPRELTKQVEVVDEVIASLDGLIGGKIKVELYGKAFLEPLSEVRKMALELRSSLEVFKGNLEHALTAQYYSPQNERFASEETISKVIDNFLSKSL